VASPLALEIGSQPAALTWEGPSKPTGLDPKGEPEPGLEPNVGLEPEAEPVPKPEPRRMTFSWRQLLPRFLL